MCIRDRPDIDGLAVLDHVRATSPESVVLIMTAFASVESAIEALRRGAHDYVLKPLSYADDDAVRFYSLFRELAGEAALFTLLLSLIHI